MKIQILPNSISFDDYKSIAEIYEHIRYYCERRGISKKDMVIALIKGQPFYG